MSPLVRTCRNPALRPRIDAQDQPEGESPLSGEIKNARSKE